MLSSDARQEVEDEEEASDREKLTTRQCLDKYKAAAEALNKTMGVVVAACTPGARVLDICELGDYTITKSLEGVFKKGYEEKGVAFPTCLSINSNVCHMCPLPSDDTELKEKDIVRIEMACHVDGYIASQVHTLFVTRRVGGRAADVICAVNKATEIISDVVGPGTKVQDFNEIIQEVARCFGCKVLDTSGCRLLKQYSSFSIPTPDEGEILRDRAYMIDIAFASEQGELEHSDERQTTVYRSTVGADYELPDETLGPIFNEIKQKFPKMPFCVRSLVSFTRARISACTQLGILQPYHILHLKSGLVAHTRFTLLVRPIKTSRITEAPQQALHPMVAVDLLGDLDRLWAKMCQKNKGQGQAQKKLSYCGRLPIGEESCGSKPHISDVSWNVSGHWGSSEALACTGNFGTYVYLRSKSITMEPNPNIEDGWKKVVIQDTPGQCCKWSPDGVYLAIGVVRDDDEVPEVYIFYWDDVATEIKGRRIYEGREAFCQFLNPLSWSHDSRYLVAPSDRTHHIPVLKVEKIHSFVHPVRFSESKTRYDYICAAFHPRMLLFIAASTTGRLKLYEVDHSKLARHPIANKAEIWIEDGEEWDDDKIGTLDLSFCTKTRDRLACARSDWTVKVWSFQHDPIGHSTSLSPLFVIDSAGVENLSVKWTRTQVDFLAVGDGRQVISIYGYENADKLCGNEHSADLSACFKKATRTEWRPKHFVLASGGYEGFILFWCLHSRSSEVFLAPKHRNIYVENIYYTHTPLLHGTASTALQEIEKSQAKVRQEYEKTQALLKNVVAESDVKNNHLDKIAVLANGGLSRISEGGASVDELADYFREILRLSTKQTQ